MGDDCNQGKDDYGDIQDRALGARRVCYLMRKQTVYVRSRHTDHYNIIFLLEQPSIHVVEYSECFVTDAPVFCRSLWGSVVFMYVWVGHQTLQTACSDRGTIHWWRRAAFRSPSSEYTYFYILLSCIEYLQWHFCEVCLQKRTWNEIESEI